MCEDCRLVVAGTFFRVGPGMSDTAVLGPFYVIVRRDFFDSDEVLVSVTSIPLDQAAADEDPASHTGSSSAAAPVNATLRDGSPLAARMPGSVLLRVVKNLLDKLKKVL